MNWYIVLLTNVLVAVVTLIMAVWISNYVALKLRKLGKKHEELDETLFGFLASLARYSILVIAGIFVLARFGVQTTSLVALLGAAGLAVGLALQGTLSNLAAGVMLLGFRPFKVGEYVCAAGESGTVKAIRLFTVELVTPDNVQITVPNRDIWASSIMNYSFYDTRRVDLVFGVSYDADLKVTEAILHKEIGKDPRIHADPAPSVKLTNLADSAVDFTVKVWCNREDYADVKYDLLRAVKEAFDEGGIEIPFTTITQIQRAG